MDALLSDVSSVINGPVQSDLKPKSNRTDKKSSQTKPNQIDLKPQVKLNQSDRSVPSARRHRSHRSHRFHRSHRPTVGQFDLENGHFDLKSGQINPESGHFDPKVVKKWYFRSRDITQISKKEILFFTKIKIWVTQNFQKRKF